MIQRMLLLVMLVFASFADAQSTELNQRVIDTAVYYGRTISPTYQSAVCTEYVIGVLSHFIQLDSIDTVNIRIDQPRTSIDDVYAQIANGSPEPKGVYHALTSKGLGIPIDDWKQVERGDFVQFWYDHSWGHCGIVEYIDIENKTMMLHSSYPSTDGYGIQEFELPSYAWFVRLNAVHEINNKPSKTELSKTIRIDKIEIKAEDENVHWKKMLLVQNSDTLNYRKFRKKSLEVERDQGLELLLIGKSDTLRIKRLEEAFNYEKEFSISVQIPKKYDDCYELFYLSENNEETSFDLSLQDGSVFKKKGKHECVMIYVSSRILKFEPYKN
jgi:hypothetical protein